MSINTIKAGLNTSFIPFSPLYGSINPFTKIVTSGITNTGQALMEYPKNTIKLYKDIKDGGIDLFKAVGESRTEIKNTLDDLKTLVPFKKYKNNRPLWGDKKE